MENGHPAYYPELIRLATYGILYILPTLIARITNQAQAYAIGYT
jgi:hypothetical protein